MKNNQTIDQSCQPVSLPELMITFLTHLNYFRYSKDDPDFEELKALRTQQTMVHEQYLLLCYCNESFVIVWRQCDDNNDLLRNGCVHCR